MFEFVCQMHSHFYYSHITFGKEWHTFLGYLAIHRLPHPMSVGVNDYYTYKHIFWNFLVTIIYDCGVTLKFVYIICLWRLMNVKLWRILIKGSFANPHNPIMQDKTEPEKWILLILFTTYFCLRFSCKSNSKFKM